MRLFTLAAAAASLVVALPAAAVNVTVANASFETLPPGVVLTNCGPTCNYTYGYNVIPDWQTSGTVGQSNILGFDGNPAPSDGNWFAYSNGGDIWQDVTTASAGTTYTLKVDQLHRSDTTPVPVLGTMVLQLDGVTVANATGGDAGPGTWNLYTATWTAGAADAGKTLTIRLSAPGQQGDFDNVRLTSAVPEPSEWALMAGGLGVLGLLARRRRRNA